MPHSHIRIKLKIWFGSDTWSLAAPTGPSKPTLGTLLQATAQNQNQNQFTHDSGQFWFVEDDSVFISSNVCSDPDGSEPEPGSEPLSESSLPLIGSLTSGVAVVP